MTAEVRPLDGDEMHPTGAMSVRCVERGCGWTDRVPLPPGSTVADGAKAAGDAYRAHYRARHLAAAMAVFDAGDGAPR